MYAIVRLRGTVNVNPDIRYTLRLLHLPRVNHCVVVEENGYYAGMIQKVKDYVAWGEISADTLQLLLRRRGRVAGGKRLTEEYIRAHTPYSGFEELVQALIDGKIRPKELANYHIKPVFRLHPPRKGHRGIKRSVTEGGELGYHGKGINELLLKMR